MRSRFLEPPPSESDLSEQRVIQHLLIQAGSGHSRCTVGPGDDCAVLTDGTTVTTDTLMESVHWDQRLSPADVGWKSVAVSVSDLAAMGAQPAWMVLSLALPRPLDMQWVDGFATGMREAIRAFGVELVGGDTIQSPVHRSVSITMGGSCVAQPLLRSGGSPGDELYVTGCPGLAGAGYLETTPGPASLRCLRRPTPPLHFALALAMEGLPTAMMDLSDGLTSDLPRLCAASNVGAVIDPTALPHHPELGNKTDSIALKVGAGDDYQLLFSAQKADAKSIHRIAAQHHTSIQCIGHMTKEPAVRLLGHPWPAPAYSHFDEAAQ